MTDFVLSKLDRVLRARQAKKDAKFEPPVFVERVLSSEELCRERDRRYLEENFPDEPTYIDEIVRVEDL